MKIEQSHVKILQRSYISARTPLGIMKQVLSAKFPKDIFFKYLFCRNAYIIKKGKNLINYLKTSTSPIVVLHGYAKNGKSTFIHYISYLNNSEDRDNDIDREAKEIFGENQKYRYIIRIYDFEKGSEPDLYSKLVILVKDEFSDLTGEFLEKDKYDKKVKEIRKFLDFWGKFKRDIHKEERRDVNNNAGLLDGINGLAEGLFDAFNQYLERTDCGTKGEENTVKKIFDQTILQYLNRMNQRNDLRDSAGDVLCFLILFRLFSERYNILANKEKKRKYFFVLDNIDDYLNEKDIQFLKHPQFQIMKFIKYITDFPLIDFIFSNNLKSMMQNDTENTKQNFTEENFVFSEQLKIIYSFRTANYIVFAKQIEINETTNNDSNRMRVFPDAYILQKSFQYNTIENTDEIINKRISFYKAYAEGIKLKNKYFVGFSFLESLSSQSFRSKTVQNTDTDKEELKINKQVFQMINGNKTVLWNMIVNQSNEFSDDFFHHENILETINQKNFYSRYYMLTGIYIKLLLGLYRVNKIRNIENLIHSLQDGWCGKKKKNIRRLLLNYLVNRNEQKKFDNDMQQLPVKGVGLHDLVADVNILIDRINRENNDEPPIYTMKEVFDFLEDMVKDEKDFYGNFFTVYKDQLNSDKAPMNHYHLEEEIEALRRGDYTKIIEKNIRIYNNHNASYFIRNVLTHFEFYSSFGTMGKKSPGKLSYRPLPFLIGKLGKNEYEFYPVIEEVFSHVKTAITATVDFYINKLIKIVPPVEFEKCNFFSTNRRGVFQFQLLISRHLTYIEGFRQGIICEAIGEFDEAQKVSISEYLLDKEKEYIKLYKVNYKKIKEKCKKLNFENSAKLATTVTRFGEMLSKIDDILNGNIAMETIVKSEEGKSSIPPETSPSREKTNKCAIPSRECSCSR